MHLRRATVFVALAAFSLVASATEAVAEPDPATLYELKTEGTSVKVGPGEKARLVIAIVAKEGAHVSDEAPLKIELSGTNATPEKKKLTLTDSLEKKAEGQKYPKPHFEAVFSTVAPGPATLNAKMTFFICTEKLCARQVKTLSLPVEVAAVTKTL